MKFIKRVLCLLKITECDYGLVEVDPDSPKRKLICSKCQRVRFKLNVR